MSMIDTTDRTFDQTVEHTHVPGVECEACRSSVGLPKKEFAFSWHVSPAILEARILILESDLEDAQKLHADAIKERDLARFRIKQLESFNAEMSARFDELFFPNHNPAA